MVSLEHDGMMANVMQIVSTVNSFTADMSQFNTKVSFVLCIQLQFQYQQEENKPKRLHMQNKNTSVSISGVQLIQVRERKNNPDLELSIHMSQHIVYKTNAFQNM